MQHTDRVLDAFRSGSHGGNWVGYPQLTLYWLASNTDPQHVMNAHAAYMKVKSAYSFQESAFRHCIAFVSTNLAYPVYCREVSTQRRPSRKTSATAHW